jgi:hypothetical protein
MFVAIAVLINCALVPYGIGFQTSVWKSPPVIFGWIVYSTDIVIRARTGVQVNEQLTID